jgi:tRNA modification GTPase
VKDTIAAIATPPGEGAVALLRVSGPAAVAAAAAVCQPTRGGSLEKIAPRQQVRARARAADGTKLDEVLVTRFAAPASYTGEDVVEISGHGGPLVAKRLLEAVVAAGARVAGPGEFTQRAFLNGKLDLTQVEAVMDLIRAHSDLALRAANEQLSGGLGRRIEALREDLLNLVAHVEAHIDFPDEDITPETGAALRTRLDAARGRIAELLDTARPGRILREGLRTAIVGQPNVGKSSLLNALAGRDRAIVSATPGTTRDTIEEFVSVGGLALRLVDTAGLRESIDAIEREGIERAQREVAVADLVLQVVDASLPPPAGDMLPAPSDAEQVRLLVLNKIDLGVHAGWKEASAGFLVSCTTGEGIGRLAEEIAERAAGGMLRSSAGALAAISVRHRDCLARASDALDRARETLRAGESPEFVAVDLRAALTACGEVVGGADSENILDRIFATFCLGK